MDVTHLSTTAVGKTGILKTRKSNTGGSPMKKNRVVASPQPDKAQVKAALDQIIRNTRFQYVLKDELDYFVVRIIDKDTDKIIREIPSKELQKIHEGIEEAIGVLFDEVI